MNVLSHITTQVTDTTRGVFSNYYEFLLSKNVVQLGMALIISGYITELSNTFTTTILSPILNQFLQSDNTKNLNDIVVYIGDVKLGIGKLLHAVLKFLIMTFLLYILLSYIIPQTK